MLEVPAQELVLQALLCTLSAVKNDYSWALSSAFHELGTPCVGRGGGSFGGLEARLSMQKRADMASAASVLALIRAARPIFRNEYDRVAFAVHAAFLAAGYRLIAAGAAAEVETEGTLMVQDPLLDTAGDVHLALTEVQRAVPAGGEGPVCDFLVS